MDMPLVEIALHSLAHLPGQTFDLTDVQRHFWKSLLLLVRKEGLLPSAANFKEGIEQVFR